MAVSKSPDAFRTISEVADWLEVQAHVLRFWESKFSQVKPVKRAGGRRYYRPVDMLLLGGIKQLLHEDGMTIKGVQKILREKGVAHVSSFSRPLDSELIDQEAGEVQEATVVDFRSRGADEAIPEIEEAEIAPDPVAEEEPDFEEPVTATGLPSAPEPETEPEPEPEEEHLFEADEPEFGNSPRLPSFLHREFTPPPVAAEPEPPIVDAPDPAPDDALIVEPGLLARLASLQGLSTSQKREIAPIAAELRGWVSRAGGERAL